ncbi:MAG: large subunit ribosomal protein L21e [Thermoproteota archaeon]|nr:large subunit ribosomal protein L21e [Thermoproteota archaeon]
MGRSQGIHKKYRAVLRKNVRDRGMTPLGRLLREYKNGERVVITLNSSVHKGMPHPRYQGKVGIVDEKRGHAYVVKIKEGEKNRSIIARPEHITPYTG